MRVTSPRAVQFDPAEGTASPVIEALLEGPGSAGPVVLLAVGSAAQRSGWAADAAVALAEAFAARGENVILADLSLDEPELHARLGVSNDEGLTDVFLFGASLQHTAARVPGRKFRLIPASQFTPDSAEMLTHERWSGVFEELASEKSKLVAYLPIVIAGASAYSERVGHTIVLADPRDIERIEATLSRDADIISVLTPPRIGAVHEELRREPPASQRADVTAAPALERLDDREFEKIRIPKDAAREALIADLRKRQRDALMAPAPAMTPLPEEAAPVTTSSKSAARSRKHTAETGPQPLFTVRAIEPTPRRSRAWMTWMLLLMLLAAAAAGGWYLWQTNGLKRPAPLVRKPASQRAAPQEITPTAEFPGTKLPYSVAIASYPVLQTANDQLAQLTAQQAGIRFYIAPLLMDGKMFFRVMAGPLPDSTEAVAMRDSLIAKRIKTITSGWDVVSTPYAFLLGEYATRDDAERARHDAEKKTLPAYIVEVTTPGGSTWYRLYAGAFTGPGDADFMRSLLRSAGYTEKLVERTGSIS